jgi:hypothetical protein
MKRAMKGDFDLFGEAEKLFNDLEKIDDGKISGETYYQEKKRYTGNFKKVILICIHGAMKQYGKSLISEQEVMNNIAEMMIEAYLSESLALRVEKLGGMKGIVSVYRDILDVNIYDTASRIRKSATDAVCSFASSDALPKLVNAIEILSKVSGINIKDARRRIADKLIADNAYKF